MTRALDVRLIARSEASQEASPLPMPYCGFCFHRAFMWRQAHEQGLVRAATIAVVATVVVAFPVLSLDLPDLTELVVALRLVVGIAWGGLRNGRRIYGLRREVSGHAPCCDAVSSPERDAFVDGDRVGRTLVFANWRFGVAWGELNGVVLRPSA